MTEYPCLVTVGTINGAATTTAATPIPATPFQITPVVPTGGIFDTDRGVVDAATNQPLTLVASGPVAGQYSVAAGVYTFSSADHVSGISVKISFAYHFSTGPMAIEADVTTLGSEAVAVTLSTDYAMLDPPGYPSRASFTGCAAANLQYPRTIANGTTFRVLRCEAAALVAANAATYA